jgi:fatty-acyl-CoA synthase
LKPQLETSYFKGVETPELLDQSIRMKEIQAGLSAHDVINIQFTSGTTGNPKAASLTHHNILNNANQVAAGMKLSEQDRLCIPVPMYHCFGMVLGKLACVTRGAAAVFPADSFDPGAVLKDGEVLSADEIRAFCKDHIAYFKVPLYIRLVDGFPITVTGKVQNFRMREQMEKELGKLK